MRKTKALRIAVISEWSNSYARRFLEGVAKFAADRQNWSLELFNPAFFSKIKFDLFDGFICRLPDIRSGNRMEKLGRPVVESMHKDPFGRFVTVCSDISAVCKLAADHFVHRRHTHFAYCGFDGQLYSEKRGMEFANKVREAGFETHMYKAPRDARKRFADSMQYTSPVDIADAKALRSWLMSLPKPAAVFCCNDRRAFHVATVCRAAGLRVPLDIAILGVDNDSMFCEFSYPRLSSIDPDAVGVGHGAAATLAGMLGESGFRQHKPGEIVQFSPKGTVDRASTAVFPIEPEWLADALLFIRRHVSDNITAADVFAHTKLSHSTVDMTFRKKLGTTVQREIASARLEVARQLLSRQDIPVNEVSRMSGFSSPQYFCRCFKERFGVSPSEFAK